MRFINDEERSELISVYARERSSSITTTTTSASTMAAVATTSQRPLLPASGRELLLDLKRSLAAHSGTSSNKSSTSTTLPTYNTKLVQACLQSLQNEVQELNLKLAALDRSQDDEENKEESEGPIFHMSARPVILLHSESIERHKRCLLAYHYQRMELLKEIVRRHKGNRNENMDVVESTPKTTPVSQNQHEVQFAKNYQELRSNYAATVGIDLDLPMPVSNMVMIKCTDNLGQVILPNSGRQVFLQQGATLFLDRADAMDLLHQGAAQLVSKTEEVDF
jgi:GINS complex subunit 1